MKAYSRRHQTRPVNIGMLVHIKIVFTQNHALTQNWDSVLYLGGKRTEQFLSELLIRQSNDDM